MVAGQPVAIAIPLGIIDVVLEHVLHKPQLHLERQPLIVGCTNLVAFGVAIALGLFLNRQPFRKAFPFTRITSAQVASMMVLVLDVGVLLSEVYNAFWALLPRPRWLLNILQDLFLRENQLLSRIFLLVIVAPLTKELLFRGIILRGLLSRFRLPRLLDHTQIHAQNSGAAGQNVEQAGAASEGKDHAETRVNGGVWRTLAHSDAVVELERAKGFESC